MAKRYTITNYGNTRTIYIKGQSWEISKGSTISITKKDCPNHKEVADAFEKLQFVDVEVEVIKQSKKIVRKMKKKKVTVRLNKKIKRHKKKRSNKHE